MKTPSPAFLDYLTRCWTEYHGPFDGPAEIPAMPPAFLRGALYALEYVDTSLCRYVIPMKPAAKARPRVTCRGTYMPKKYELWRNSFAAHVRSQTKGSVLHLFPLTCRVSFRCCFSSPGGKIRPDIDNAVGAILDSIQATRKGSFGLIEDDKQVSRIDARIVDGPTQITFDICEDKS